MGNPILYYVNLSPPSRAVLLLAKYLGVDLDLKVVNLLAGEHLTPEYRKVSMNIIADISTVIIM